MRISCRPRSVLRACLLACLSVCLSVRPPARPSVSVSARAHALASSLKDLRPAQEHPPRGVGATVRRHSMYVPRVCLPVCEHRNTRHGVPVSAKKKDAVLGRQPSSVGGVHPTRKQEARPPKPVAFQFRVADTTANTSKLHDFIRSQSPQWSEKKYALRHDAPVPPRFKVEQPWCT